MTADTANIERADLAFPLPMAVIGAAPGVREEDWPLFQQWWVDFANAIDRPGQQEAGEREANFLLPALGRVLLDIQGEAA